MVGFTSQHKDEDLALQSPRMFVNEDLDKVVLLQRSSHSVRNKFNVVLAQRPADSISTSFTIL